MDIQHLVGLQVLHLQTAVAHVHVEALLHARGLILALLPLGQLRPAQAELHARHHLGLFQMAALQQRYRQIVNHVLRIVLVAPGAIVAVPPSK